MKNKSEILGQYFTKVEVVEKLLKLLFGYKKYNKQIKILEPSFGTGNFIRVLKEKDFHNIEGCEIDKGLAEIPCDFFDFPVENRYDLIIGNPPFTKYNIKESYYFTNRYINSPCNPHQYLTIRDLKKDKLKIEEVFILKSLKHLKDDNSSIAFILPISFFIKKKNISVKNQILKHFSTVIIYQNQEIWFDRNIPCCFAIFTNAKNFKNQIILIFENNERNEEVLNLVQIHEELIPQIAFNRNNLNIKNEKGVPLAEFLGPVTFHVKKSFQINTVSAKNILEKTKIPGNKEVQDYELAIVRVGNASVGRSGLIDLKEDVLNDMFYVFGFKGKYRDNRQIKESICGQINNNLDYFRDITCRVGSKSIRKEHIYQFKVALE